MHRLSKLATALALVTVAGASGCGIVKVTWPEQKPQEFSYRGDECKGDSYDESTRSQIAFRLCEQRKMVNDYGTIHAIATRHQAFDDRRPDMIVAAFQAIDCSRACENHPLDLGMSSFYAGILDEQKLRASLKGIDLTDGGRDAFVQLSMSSKTDVLERAKKLDPRRKHMYVEVPGEVVAKRRAYFTKYAELYGKLDKALERAKTVKKGAAAGAAPVAHELMDLRGGYLDKCGTAECRFDPFVYESTRALVTLHLVSGDELLAAAEEDIVQEPAAGRQRFGVEVGFALYQAMEEERKANEEYEHSKSAGMDKAALDAKYGTPPPIKVDPDRDYMASEVPPRLTKRGPETAYESESGFFKARKDVAGKTGPLGDPLVEVAFKDNVTKEDVTSCFETNRVTGVHFEGDHARLEFESVCNTVGTKTNVEKIVPVLVPKSDAENLQPGEVVIALVDRKTRVGVVIRTQTPLKGDKGKKVTPVTQIRDHRLPASAEPAEPAKKK